MAIRIDLTGNVYGKLTVISYSKKDKHGVSYWLCRCECGVEKVCNSMTMKAGRTVSCGCVGKINRDIGRAKLITKRTTHGKSGTREHHIWQNMIYRCENENCRQFKNYGERGIKVCDEWRWSFEAFLEDMGELPTQEHSIDRIDNDGNYEPENCQWSTKREQSNNRRNNRILEYNGQSLTMQQWADKIGMNKITIHARLSAGWSVAKAIETPIDEKKRRKAK